MSREQLVREEKEKLFARKRAYLNVFDESNQFLVDVLQDLARFCREKESTFHADPRIHALLEGRREVMQRIKDHLEMESDDLWRKYGEKGSKR